MKLEDVKLPSKQFTQSFNDGEWECIFHPESRIKKESSEEYGSTRWETIMINCSYIGLKKYGIDKHFPHFSDHISCRDNKNFESGYHSQRYNQEFSPSYDFYKTHSGNVIFIYCQTRPTRK